MIRGTTPTFQLKLVGEEVDLTQANNVYATFKQEQVDITKTGEDIEVSSNQVDVYLSQAETLSFRAGTVYVQLNWTYDDGRRACSNIISINVGKNLIGSELV